MTEVYILYYDYGPYDGGLVTEGVYSTLENAQNVGAGENGENKLTWVQIDENAWETDDGEHYIEKIKVDEDV